MQRIGSHLQATALVVAPAVLSLVVYLLTLAPTVTSEDSGELITAAYFFGVPHPPGYPLWTLLCGIFMKIVFFGSSAYRANLFSAVCTSLSTMPLHLALRTLGLQWPSCLTASLIWALSGTLWAQSVITEVYGLHALLCTLLLWSMVKWPITRSKRWLGLASLWFGLGMCVHHTIGFVAVAVGLWALILTPSLLKDWKLIARCVVVFCLGLLPNLYLPIRAAAQTPMNWGDPSTWSRFVEHVTRGQYGSTAPLQVEEPRSLARLGQQLLFMAEVVTSDLTYPLTILSLVGLVGLTWRRKNLALMALLLLLFSGFLFVLMSNIDLDRVFRFAMRVFFIPLSMAMVIPIAYVLDSLSSKLERRFAPRLRPILTALVLAPVALPLTMNWKRCDYSNYWWAYDHAKNLLASMLPNAIIFPSGDHDTFPLIYLTLVEKLRPDVTIADKYGYVDPAMITEIARQQGETPDPKAEEDKKEYVIRRARRPVYYTTMASSPVETASFVPVGVTYHLLPHDRIIDQDGIWQEISYRNLDSPTAHDLGSAYIEAEFYMFKGLNEFRLERPERALELFAKAAELAHGLKECLNNIGSAVADHGHVDQAIPYFEQARQVDKHYVMPRWNLFRTFQPMEKWDDCEPLLLEILAAKPDDFQVHRELGFFMRDVRGDFGRARLHFEQSLKDNPAQPDVLKALLELMEAP